MKAPKNVRVYAALDGDDSDPVEVLECILDDSGRVVEYLVEIDDTRFTTPYGTLDDPEEIAYAFGILPRKPF